MTSEADASPQPPVTLGKGYGYEGSVPSSPRSWVVGASGTKAMCVATNSGILWEAHQVQDKKQRLQMLKTSVYRVSQPLGGRGGEGL